MSHNHTHLATNYNKAFAVGIILNVAFSLIEAIYGFLSNSMALVADAGHNFSDVISLVIAWGAIYLAAKKPTPRRTYGFSRLTILASLASAILLLIAVGAISLESVKRFSNPQQLEGTTIIIVAGIGIIINLITAFMFIKDQQKDINIKGAFLHMMADAGVSFGVVLAGIAILSTGWLWLDPAISILIVVIILIGTWGLLKDSLNLVLDYVPKNINPDEVKKYLEDLPEVEEVHDLHIWAMSTTEVALTAHLIIPEKTTDDIFLQNICKTLYKRFEIDHPTIQIEKNNTDEFCSQSSPDSI